MRALVSAGSFPAAMDAIRSNKQLGDEITLFLERPGSGGGSQEGGGGGGGGDGRKAGAEQQGQDMTGQGSVFDSSLFDE